MNTIISIIYTLFLLVCFIGILLGSFIICKKIINRIFWAQLFAIFQIESTKSKHYLKRENKVNQIRYHYILKHYDTCKYICTNMFKTMKKVFHCVKLTKPLSLKTRFPKMDQHTGGKWLIHGTKHRKDNRLQSLEVTRRIS